MFVISLQLLKSILVRVSAVLDSITKNRLVNGNSNKRNKGVDLLKYLPSPPLAGNIFRRFFLDQLANLLLLFDTFNLRYNLYLEPPAGLTPRRSTSSNRILTVD